MNILINTITGPGGKSRTYDIQKPTNIDTSLNKIDIDRVFLKLFPTFIAAATGMIIKDDTSNTPTITIDKETTKARTNVDTNWKRPILIPTSFAYASSKLTRMIFLRFNPISSNTIAAVIIIRITKSRLTVSKFPNKKL